MLFKVFKLDVKASREEINNLSDRIRNAVDSVTNIDLIIQSTKGDSEKAKALKKRAEYAKYVPNHFIFSEFSKIRF